MVDTSVIITTNNRPLHLKRCIQSILKNNFDNFEIIIIDQSKNDKTKKLVSRINFEKITYKRQNEIGKSRAINYALNFATGKILAFTDDDCIVEKKWLEKLKQDFGKREDLTFLFGKVLPFEPRKNEGFFVVLPNYELLVSEKLSHLWDMPTFDITVVSGNNMAIKREFLNTIGKFKIWLGTGSLGYGGEDTEIAYRALVYKGAILYNSAIRVYHNGWLDKDSYERKIFYYFCGFISVFVYYLIKGNKEFAAFLKKILIEKINDWEKQILMSLRKLCFFCLLRVSKLVVVELIFTIRSLILPVYYYFRETIYKID